MQEVEKSAKERARLAIAERFSGITTTSREDIALLRSQLRNQLLSTTSQLNQNVQSRLDAMKRAVDIMSVTEEKVSNTFTIMKNIDQNIQDTSIDIAKFETLKRAHFARENLHKVLAQVDFFARVPDRISELYGLLEGEPYRLKEIYLGAIKLQSLRDFLLVEISMQQRQLEREMKRAKKKRSKANQLVAIERAKKRGQLIMDSKSVVFQMKLSRTDLEGTKWGIVMSLNEANKLVVDSFLPNSIAANEVDSEHGYTMKVGDIIEEINGDVVPSGSKFQTIKDVYAFMKTRYSVKFTIRRLRSPAPSTMNDTVANSDTEMKGEDMMTAGNRNRSSSRWSIFSKASENNKSSKMIEDAARKDFPVLPLANGNDVLTLQEFSDDSDDDEAKDGNQRESERRDKRYQRQKSDDMTLEDQGTQIQLIKDIVEEHLKHVPNLFVAIRHRLTENLENILLLAEKSPADLVMCFEIIEMHQEYLDRIKLQRLNRHLKANMKEGKDMYDINLEISLEDIECEDEMMWRKIKSHSISLFIEKLKEKIKDIFDRCADGDGVDVSEIPGDGKITRSQITLAAGKRILEMMSIYDYEVVPCIPPEYKPIEIFLVAVEEFLVVEVMETVGNIGPDNHYIFNLINFLEKFIAQVESFGLANHQVCAKFIEASDKLIGIYEERLRVQIMIWYGNIKKSPKEVIQSEELGGLLITTAPEDIFNVLNSQVEVSYEKLSLSKLIHVIRSTTAVLGDIQRDTLMTLRDSFTEITPEQIAAAVNDNHRMQEKVDIFVDTIKSQWLPNLDDEKLMNRMEDISNEFLSVSVEAVHFLTQVILYELEGPVISMLFGQEWEAGGKYVGTIIATLEDYFPDISVWLPEFFYCKFVKEMLINLVKKYVITLGDFGENCVDSYTFESELNAAKLIINDFESIRDFFMQPKQAAMLKKCGLGVDDDIENAIINEMKPIQLLARVVGASHLSAVQADVEYLLHRLGEDAIRIVRNAIKLSPNLNKTEKQQSEKLLSCLIEKVEQERFSNLQSHDQREEDYQATFLNMFANIELTSPRSTGKKKKKNTRGSTLGSFFFPVSSASNMPKS